MCHPLLDFLGRIGIYYDAPELRRWTMAHPIGTAMSTDFFFFSDFFFCSSAVKKYFQISKWGSIPKYPLQSAMKAEIC
jgi:hypothetical protein